MGCSIGKVVNEQTDTQNRNQVKKKSEQNKNKKNKKKDEIPQRREQRINSFRSSIRDKKNGDNQSNEKILSNKKSKEMILSERETQSLNRNQLSLIQEEFPRKKSRKKSRSRSLRNNNKEKNKKRSSKKYKTERLNNEGNEESENDELNNIKNEGKTVIIKEKPIYYNESNEEEYTNNKINKDKKLILESNEGSNEIGNNKKNTLSHTLSGKIGYSTKKSLEIKLKKNNTLTSSDNNSGLLKKSNLKQNSNKMLTYINVNDNNDNEYSNIKYNTRKKRKTKRSSSNITTHGSNFFQNKTPKLNLQSSNKDSNSVTDENNSKQSGKLYTLEKQSGKLYTLENRKSSKFGRQSTRQILINDFINIEKDNEPLKRELTKIIEKEKLSNLIQIDEKFNKINEDLIANFNDLFKNNKEIHNIFDICVKKKYCIEKENYEDPIYFEKIKINIINKFRSNNWEKEPLLRIKNKINNIMANNKYKKYSEINFDNYYKEYEIIAQNIKFPLLKGFLNSNKIEESYIDFTKTNIKLIFFFDIDDLFSLNVLKLISYYNKENKDLFNFFPIYGNHIHKKDEISNILQTIRNQISLNQQEIYFIRKENSELIEQSFFYHSNEQINNIISNIYLIDENNRIRAISDLKDFQTGMINNLNETMEKPDFTYKINTLINLFEEQKSIKIPFKSKLSLKKVLIYEYDNTKNDFEKTKIFEGISGYIENNSELEKQIKQNIDMDYSSLIDKINISKTNNNDIKYINGNINNLNQKEKEINNIIQKEINIFLNQVNAEEIDDYYNIFSYFYNINSINDLKYPEENLKIKQEKHFKMEIPLSKLLFEQFQFSITNAMTSLFQYPNLGNIEFLSCIPYLKDEFPKKFKLIIPENNFEKELIQIILPHQPNLIIIINYTTDFFAKIEIESRFKKLKKFIDDEDINVNVIFKGEQIDYQTMIDDLNFIYDNNLKIYISDNTNKNFPFYCNNYGNNNENAFYCILTNKKGQISYFGDFNNIKIQKLFNDIKAIDNEVNINEYYYEEIDIDEINNIINKLEGLIKNEFFQIKDKEPLKYRPFIQISYDKRYHYKTKNEKIENLRIKILIKERHKKIFTSNKEIKNIFKHLRNKYNALILIVPLECEEILTPENCEKCGKKILEKEQFYYDQTVNIIYCDNCESNIQNGLTHLIFFKSNDYNKEIINEFYFSNISKKEPLEKNLPNYCSICEQKLGSEFYLSLTQFNIKNGYSPLSLCQICFNDLNIWGCFNNDNEYYNQKLYCLHSDNIVMRKIVLN